MPQAGRLIVGTSGFSYAHWAHDFYSGIPQSRWLESYSERFSTVELNVTFYRLPPAQTFASWARRTPGDFRFAVKGSRAITHYRRLKDAEKPVARLFSAASSLGGKLSCFLWQLPPDAVADPGALKAFGGSLASLAEEAGLGRDVRHAFEFRNASWFAPQVLDVLRSQGHALVIAYPGPAGRTKDITAGFTYLRFHHGTLPGGGFGAAALTARSREAASAISSGTDVYAYFNNDNGGWAPRNAETFRRQAAKATGIAEPVSAVAVG